MNIMKCIRCEAYTLMDKCEKCGATTISPHPMKFSIEKEQRYGKYRRQKLKLG